MRAGLQLRDQAAFSLIELLIVSTVGLVLLAGAGSLLTAAAHSDANARERAAAVPQARVMMEGLTRELREGHGVEVAEPNRIVLLTFVGRSTCGGSPATSSIQCRVSYECAAGSCTRAEGEPGGSLGPARTVVEGIAAEDVFGYGPDASDPNYVSVRLRMPVGDGAEDAITLEDGVALRNVAPGGP